MTRMLRLQVSRFGAAVAACLVAACSLPGIGGPPAPVLKIGVDLPLTGAEGRVARPALNGVRFFLQSHPTVEGFTLSLAIKDDSLNGLPEAPLGAANIQAFAGDPQVMAVIGPFDSSVARAEIPLANQTSLAMVSPATSSPCLTKPYYLPAGLRTSGTPITCKDAGLPAAADLRPSGVNNYFRLPATDELQGPAAADYAFKTLHLLRVATVSDREAYGEALVTGFDTRFRALGGSIAGGLDYDPAVPVDATAYLKRMKSDGVQAIYFGGIAANRGCMVRSQMAGIFDPGEGTPFLGGDGIALDPACVQDAGANATGMYATVPIIDAASAGPGATVIAAFRAAFPNAADYGAYTLLAYDGAALVYDALDRAIKAANGQAPPRGNVISQLSATHGFRGSTGVLGFDGAGDSTLRVLSVFEAPAGPARDPWRLAGAIDYTTVLPY